jgi:acyl-coenzyme A synthetase/AMP-(fatty) acid ligase
VLKDRTRADPGIEETLTAFVKGRLAPFKYPRWVTILDELPKTASGKIQRFRLRRRGD